MFPSAKGVCEGLTIKNSGKGGGLSRHRYRGENKLPRPVAGGADIENMLIKSHA